MLFLESEARNLLLFVFKGFHRPRHRVNSL